MIATSTLDQWPGTLTVWPSYSNWPATGDTTIVIIGSPANRPRDDGYWGRPSPIDEDIERFRILMAHHQTRLEFWQLYQAIASTWRGVGARYVGRVRGPRRWWLARAPSLHCRSES